MKYLHKKLIACMMPAMAVILLLLVSCAVAEQEEESSETQDKPRKKFAEDTQETEGAEEGSGEEPERCLLVVMDTSGSASNADEAVTDMVRFTLWRIQSEESVGSIGYIGFDTSVKKYETDSREIKDWQCKGLSPSGRNETAVMPVFHYIDQWISTKMKENGEGEKQLCVIVFSDLFTTRTADGEKYNQETAREDQLAVAGYLDAWEKLIEKDILDLCFVTWESASAGECKEKTWEYISGEKTDNDKKESINAENVDTESIDAERMSEESIDIRDERFERGFQIVLDEDIGTQIFLKETIGHDEVMENCKDILTAVTGKEDLEWKKHSTASPKLASRKIAEPAGTQMLILIECKIDKIVWNDDTEQENRFKGKNSFSMKKNDIVIFSYCVGEDDEVSEFKTEEERDVYYLAMQ